MRRLQRDDLQRWVKRCEVPGIAADHGVIALARADHDGCVDDMSGARMPAQGTGGTSLGLVERDDRDRGEPEEERETGLGRAIAPRLSDSARRHGEIGTDGLRLVEQGLDAGLTALDRDQRARVECDPGHSGQSKRPAGPRTVFVGKGAGFAAISCSSAASCS